MFGGVPQPQTSRNGPKRPETAVFGVNLMPPAAGRRRENLLRFTIGDHQFFAPWRNCPKTRSGYPNLPIQTP